MNNLIDRLITKSIEAFIVAIELYNKPTIKYRVEGFGLFICNAWELMIKAHMIKRYGESSIYYEDNTNRTRSLENCIKKCFTNDKDPVRLNLEKIIELRNTSTHFIVTEYESLYVSLFQANVINFTQKMAAFHNVDMTDYVPLNFLTLSVSMTEINEQTIRAKYSNAMVNKFMSLKKGIDELSDTTNNKFAIRVEHHFFIEKDKNKATDTIRIDSNSSNVGKIITKLQDPAQSHQYTQTSLIKTLTSRLQKEEICLFYKGNQVTFNKFHFENLCKYFGIKETEKFCYAYKAHKIPQYTYSQYAVDFLLKEIKKDPMNILDNVAKKKSLVK